jgi:hypothetical protein
MNVYSLESLLEYKKDLIILVRKSESNLQDVIIKRRPNPWGQGICSDIKILISGKKPINVIVTLLGEVLSSDKSIYPNLSTWLNNVKTTEKRQKERCSVLKQELLELVLEKGYGS